MTLVGLVAASVPGACLQRDNPVSGTSRADMTRTGGDRFLVGIRRRGVPEVDTGKEN